MTIGIGNYPSRHRIIDDIEVEATVDDMQATIGDNEAMYPAYFATQMRDNPVVR